MRDHMNTDKTYRVKILDFSYKKDFLHLTFKYLFYDVVAEHKEDAVKRARSLYMKGEKEDFCEELPLMLKLFTIDSSNI